MRDSFSHSYVCMYICMYVSIYIYRESVCKKQVDCLWKQICVYAICMYICMYELCVIECVCIPLFCFLKRHKHTQRTHFQHLQSPSICQRRSWCRQRSSSALSNPRTSRRRSWCTEPSLRYIHTHYHTQLCAKFYISRYHDDVCMYVSTFLLRSL